MSLTYLFFEVAKFIIHCILSQILILLQPCHNRTERILLIMQIFPKINHFILKFNYSFTIKPLIFEPHLFLHKKQSIDRLVFFVVLFQFLWEMVSLLNQLINSFQIGSFVVHFPHCLFIQQEILLEIVKVVVPFQPFPL